MLEWNSAMLVPLPRFYPLASTYRFYIHLLSLTRVNLELLSAPLRLDNPVLTTPQTIPPRPVLT